MAEIKSNLVDLEVVYNKLNATIDKNINLLKEGATAVDAYNKKISVVPSEFQKSLTDIKTKMDSVSVSTKKLEQTEKQLQQARLKELQLAKQREQAFDKFTKNNLKETNEIIKVSGLYNKTQNTVKQLTEAYNNLAIKKAYGHTLSAREEADLYKLTSELNIYQTALKKVDADIQKNQRNVGNYTKGWNGLGNSINQLSREMPAFVNSAQTGFMAISNNLPILFDEINNIKKANKELIAQGKPIQSLGSQIAGAFFSIGTALSVGVTLLTIYGPKLWDSISGSKAKKEALEAEKKALEDKNNAERQAYQQQIQYASSEISRSKILMETAKNVSLSYKQRVKAVEELQSRYPSYLGNLSKEEILAGKTANAEYRLNDALMKRAMFLAIKDKIAETTKELVDAEFDYIQLEKQATDSNKMYDEQLQKTTKTKQKFRLATDEDMASVDGLKSSVNKYNETLKKEGVAQESSTIVYQKKTLAVKEQLETLFEILNKYAKYSDIVVENTDKTKKNKEAKEDLIKVEKNSKIAFEKNIQALEGQINATSKLNPIYGALEFQLKLLKDAYEALYGEQKKQESVQDPKFGTLDYYENLKSKIQEQQKSLATTNPQWEHYQRLLEAVQIDIDILTGKQEKLNETFFDSKGYFKSFVDSFASGSGFSEIFKVMDLLNQKFESAEEKAKVVGLAMSEAFQQAFNTISEASQANFDAEYERLEKQRDFAIEMAGGSATAREEIDRQYDERKKAIQRREAEAQKRLAIFNILINTAQAVVSALPNIPLSIAVGVIGAVQAGLVASQEIPQFWKGTDNAPEGLAWTQEKGAEVITDKNGNVKTLGSDKGAQLTYLSKGDKVYKSHEDYINKVLSKNGISDLGSYMNFMPKNDIVNNGITKEDLEQNFSKLASVIKNKDGVNISIDERGFRKKQGNTEFINSRLNLKSRQV